MRAPHRMDRTEEFFGYVDMARQEPVREPETSFYNTFNRSIGALRQRLERNGTFRAVLAVEEEFVKLQSQMSAVLDSVRLEGAADIGAHYEGVKQILNLRLLGLSRRLRAAKNRVSSEELELRPERPASCQEIGVDRALERENKRITEGQRYEATRSRILKIEAVQKAINENLLVQDERIDAVCASAGSTVETYDKIAADADFDSGSIMRRAAFTVLLCLSFVLLFLHYFYK
ncbi:hypothetical protein PAPHI01_2130 [Pancytospora philotis]|nr:hypothetical protein PAPHI01_2130 [Pancytospora philotis]